MADLGGPPFSLIRPAVGPLPLRPESFMAVTAMLIHGGYGSVPNYLSRARDAHCELYDRPAWWAREHRRASAAGTRGIGLLTNARRCRW